MEILNENGNVRHEAFQEQNGGVNQRVWMLVNKGRAFRDILELKLINKLVGGLLGDNFILSSFSANIAKPGGIKMPLHTDQWWA